MPTKRVKIPEIALLEEYFKIIKKKEINASKTYIRRDRHAARAKKTATYFIQLRLFCRVLPAKPFDRHDSRHREVAGRSSIETVFVVETAMAQYVVSTTRK